VVPRRGNRRGASRPGGRRPDWPEPHRSNPAFGTIAILKGFRLEAGIPFLEIRGRVADLWLAGKTPEMSTYYSTAAYVTVDSGFILSTGKCGFLPLLPLRTRAQ
jgi:hypothetical protein